MELCTSMNVKYLLFILLGVSCYRGRVVDGQVMGSFKCTPKNPSIPPADRHDTDSSPSDTISTSTDTPFTSTDTTSSLIETTSTSGAIIPSSTDISSSDDTDSSPSDTISTSTDTPSTSTDTTSSLIETTSTSGAIIPSSTDISSSDDTDSSPSDTISTSTDTPSTSTDTTSSQIETTSTSGAIIPTSTDISSSDDTDSSPSETISTSTDTPSTSTDTTSSQIETTSTSGAIIPTSTYISSSVDTDSSPSDTISTSTDTPSTSTDTTSSLTKTTSIPGAIIPTSTYISSSDDTDSSPSDTISTSTDTPFTSTDTTSSQIETTPTSGAIIPVSTDISSSVDTDFSPVDTIYTSTDTISTSTNTDSSPIDTSSINTISSYNDEFHNTIIPVCDDGMVKCYNGSRLGCAMLEKCVCNLTTADTIILFGGFYVNDDCTRRARCIHGNVTWDDEYFCSSNAKCEERDNVRRCYCVGGYHGDGKTCTRHTNCQDAYNAGKRDGGTYIIKPTIWLGSPFPVYCNMTDGGGWTVFQRRVDGSVDFYRNWKSYKEGFGKPDHEFWLGNDKLYHLTNQGLYTLRIDLVDREGTQYYAKYDLFRINDENDKYRLSELGAFSGTARNSGNGLYTLRIDLVDREGTQYYAKYDLFRINDENDKYRLSELGAFSGTARNSGNGKDALHHHMNQAFSTHDRDNDGFWNKDCARVRHGGWWYDHCCTANLNSDYNVNHITSSKECCGGKTSVCWKYLSGPDHNLKYTEMKIRPV
ncbi:uncharacterized protein [Apostichopus japonicus]|uniref:uncharacterized protein n=1 Tax=Stichopus japonicus TaxID=307972 RepID=UPI003AB787FB